MTEKSPELYGGTGGVIVNYLTFPNTFSQLDALKLLFKDYINVVKKKK